MMCKLMIPFDVNGFSLKWKINFILFFSTFSDKNKIQKCNQFLLYRLFLRCGASKLTDCDDDGDASYGWNIQTSRWLRNNNKMRANQIEMNRNVRNIFGIIRKIYHSKPLWSLYYVRNVLFFFTFRTDLQMKRTNRDKLIWEKWSKVHSKKKENRIIIGSVVSQSPNQQQKKK